MRVEITATCPCGAPSHHRRAGPATCPSCGRQFLVEVDPTRAEALRRMRREHEGRRRWLLLAVALVVVLGLAVRPGPEGAMLVLALGAVAAFAVRALVAESFRRHVARLEPWVATPLPKDAEPVSRGRRAAGRRRTGGSARSA